MENDKVSVIVPIYNREKYLNKCINSIINQTYKNLEIILVDDGSTDNSNSIIKEYQRNDSRIFTLFQNNFGVSSARNKGIEIATGKYIMFFDSDDELYDYSIEYLINNIKDADMILGNFVSIDDNDNIVKTHDSFKNETLTNKDLKDIVKFDPLPGNKIYRREIIQKFKIIFDNVRIGEDLNFFIKYISVSKKIITVNKCIFKYKFSNDGASRMYNLSIIDIFKSFDMIEKFLKQNGKVIMLKEFLITIRLIHYWIQIEKCKYYDKKYRKVLLYLFEIETKKLKNSVCSREQKKMYYYLLFKNRIYRYDIAVKLVEMKKNENSLFNRLFLKRG